MEHTRQGISMARKPISASAHPPTRSQLPELEVVSCLNEELVSPGIDTSNISLRYPASIWLP